MLESDVGEEWGRGLSCTSGSTLMQLLPFLIGEGSTRDFQREGCIFVRLG